MRSDHDVAPPGGLRIPNEPDASLPSAPFADSRALNSILDYLTLDEAVSFAACQKDTHKIFYNYTGNDNARAATICRYRNNVIHAENNLAQLSVPVKKDILFDYKSNPNAVGDLCKISACFTMVIIVTQVIHSCGIKLFLMLMAPHMAMLALLATAIIANEVFGYLHRAATTQHRAAVETYNSISTPVINFMNDLLDIASRNLNLTQAALANEDNAEVLAENENKSLQKKINKVKQAIELTEQIATCTKPSEVSFIFFKRVTQPRSRSAVEPAKQPELRLIVA